MTNPSTICLSLGLLLIVSITQLVGAINYRQKHHNADEQQDPPTPVFATNYHVRGVLSLPYAELNEPFNAWYDKDKQRSRTDYYGDTYKVYQFGPASLPTKSQYGAIYKLVYVPDTFEPPANNKQQQSQGHKLMNKIADTIGLAVSHLHHHERQPPKLPLPPAKTSGKTAIKRTCFGVEGSVGSTIRAQTVLPSLTDFTFDSIGLCPHLNVERRHKKCELWKLTTNVGEKKNTYKMWVARDESTGAAIPVHYYMLGYDSLLGSHYDRYDITYYNYSPNMATEEDFYFDSEAQKCGSMPGPGDDSSHGERRSHLIVQNPIHEYVIEPHRYDHIDHEFDKFKKDQEKNYTDSTHHRKSWYNFLHNLRFINGKNRQLKQYKLGLNRYADNNVNELKYLRGRLSSKGYNGGLDYAAHHHTLKGANGESTTPDSWDWNILGAVTPVKDQAVCGSCWSFGTSGTLEGAYFVKTGKLPKLSQQQMVDCSWKFGNNGCDGGEDFRAYKYVMEAGGLATEEDYGHYLGIDGKCHDNDVEKTVKISGFYNVTANDVEALKHAVVTYGPVTVAIDASRPTFTFYSHGVYYDEECNRDPDGLDHQVLVTGYTKVDGKFVWMVKNSWSTYWGNNGFILMSAENNNCGVMDAPTVPIIDV